MTELAEMTELVEFGGLWPVLATGQLLSSLDFPSRKQNDSSKNSSREKLEILF